MASGTCFAALRSRELGRRANAPSPARFLNGLSCRDEYGFWNVAPDGQPIAVPPFALAFSTTAMNGHALAAGDEEGIVTVLDTRRNLRDQMYEPTHPRFTGHDNAIFDVAWLHDDKSIATASGDATIRVFDVETSTRQALLRGHGGSAKCVRPCPSAPHFLLTAARDGDILGFDLRTRAASQPYQDPFHSPVLKISRPHTCTVQHSMTQSLGRKRKRVQADAPSTSRVDSVTSLVFSPQNHSQLFSAGASDGAVKIWDMRQLGSSCPKGSVPSVYADTPIAVAIPGRELRRDDPFKTARPHGIAHIDVDSSGRRLLVSSTDSSIYTYNARDIQLGYDKVLTGHTQTSFYIRARFSPDGNFVLSGSADSKAYIWDLQSRGIKSALSPILELAGHRGGEASAVDWCKTDMFKVATCGDDSTTKVWTLPGDSRAICRDDTNYDTPIACARPFTPRPCARRQPKRHCARLRPGNRAYREQGIRSFFEPVPRPSSSEKLCTDISASMDVVRRNGDAPVGPNDSTDGEAEGLCLSP